MRVNHQECRRYGWPHACRIWDRHRQVLAATVPVVVDPRSSPWWKVAICEESGRNDPTFGYLGILPSTWQSTQYAGPHGGTAGDYSWVVQVARAYEIIGKGVIPDQNGCWKNGW